MRYRTIVADPPWPIEWHGGGQIRRSRPTLGYATMAMSDIESLPVSSIAADDAALFLWVTAPLNREGVGVCVARAWGFVPVGEFVWDKGMRIAGAFPRVCHEVCIVARRGALRFPSPSWVASVQRWPNPVTHSQKPEHFYDMVEQVCSGPYVELFARRHRLGWDVFGDESANTVAWPGVASA